MNKLSTIIWTWKLTFPIGTFWRIHQVIRSILLPYHCLLNYLPSEGNLLDLGCGHGVFLALAKINNRNLKISGIDLSQSKINAAKLVFTRANIRPLSIRMRDVMDLPREPADAISIIDVLYLVSLNDWNVILNKCYDCLKPGGKLILKEMDRSIKWKFYLLYLQEILAVKVLALTKRSKFVFPRIEDIRSCIKSAGFKKIEEVSLDRGYYIPHKMWIGYK